MRRPTERRIEEDIQRRYRGARVSAAAIVDRSPTNPSTAASSKRVSIVQRNTNKNYLTPHEKERQITENVINCLGRSSQLGGPEHQSQYGQLSEGVHRRSPGARLTICSRSAHVDGCSPLGTFLRITVPADDARNYRHRTSVVYFRLERVSLRQCPDGRRNANGAGRTHRIRDPGKRRMEQHYGGRDCRCPSRLDRSPGSATVPGAWFDVGSCEVSRYFP
jgi:hypothetical protein